METFVVRVWRSNASYSDGSSEASPTLRGLLQHVGSGHSTPFRSGEELVHSLLSRLAEPAGFPADRPPGAGP